jgi:hypothetical protein
MISQSEKQWLKDKLPTLVVSSDGTEVSGELPFTAVYDADVGFTWLIDPCQTAPGEQLSATYKIRVQQSKSADDVPALKVEDDTIEKILDRHFYISGNACLCGPVEKYEFLSSGYSFIKFLQKLVIPFLYAQTYFDKHHKWPWGEYSHGVTGIFESYSRGIKSREHLDVCLVQLRKIKDKWPRIKSILAGRERLVETSKCFCGSLKQIRKCHPVAWFMVVEFCNDVRKNGINLDDYSQPADEE